MGRASCNKGKRGEREIAAMLRILYPDARRGFQSRQGDDEADVECTPFWVEVKRVARNEQPRKAMEQAAAATDGRVPVVFSRRDNSDWLVTMRAGDWLKLASEGERSKNLTKRLREHSEELHGEWAESYLEAADAIERLTQERDEARSEVTRLRTIMRKKGLL